MRRSLTLLCAILLCLPLAAQAAAKKKAAAPVKDEEASLEDVLGKDLAAAVEAAGEAYDAVGAAMDKRPQRKRGGDSATLRALAEQRGAYAKALERARAARVDDSLLRDQVVVSLTQSLRACDLITQGLRDEDKDEVEAGVKLASLAQADLDALSSGENPAAGGGAGAAPELGPSVGINLGLGTQGQAFNVNMDLNASYPLSKATDIGAGFTMNGNSQESSSSASGSVNLGGNVFSRYHFLEAFPQKPNLVPYVGVKAGMTWGTQWQGKGLSFSSTDSTSVDLAGQLGLLVFMDAKSAITIQAELGSSSTANADASGKVTSSSSSSSSLTVGLRRMF